MCPGESNCDRFASTAGKTHRERVRKACHPCPMLDTKTDTGTKDIKTLSTLADFGLYMRRRRMAGYPLTLDDMDPVQFEVLLMTESFVEFQEIKIRVSTKNAIIAGFGLKVE